MSTPQTTPPPDPLAILRQLDADAIRARLDEIDRERASLLALLRAARARERSERKAVARA